MPLGIAPPQTEHCKKFFLAPRLTIRYNTPVSQTPTPLADGIASLRTAILADEARGIHALILAILARLLTRLEHMIRLWQAGQLPTPRTKPAGRKTCSETVRRREAGAASARPSRRRPAHRATARRRTSAANARVGRNSAALPPQRPPPRTRSIAPAGATAHRPLVRAPPARSQSPCATSPDCAVFVA